MSEESAQIYDRARRSNLSAEEAWEDLKEISEEVDWDVERMLSEDDGDGDSLSNQELPH